MTSSVIMTSPNNTPDEPVWARKFVFTFAAGLNEAVTKTFKHNGILQKVTMKGSRKAIGVNHVVEVTNGDVVVHSIDVTTAATPAQRNMHEPIAGDITVSMQAVGTSAAAHTVTLHLRGII